MDRQFGPRKSNANARRSQSNTAANPARKLTSFFGPFLIQSRRPFVSWCTFSAVSRCSCGGRPACLIRRRRREIKSQAGCAPAKKRRLDDPTRRHPSSPSAACWNKSSPGAASQVISIGKMRPIGNPLPLPLYFSGRTFDCVLLFILFCSNSQTIGVMPSDISDANTRYVDNRSHGADLTIW